LIFHNERNSTNESEPTTRLTYGATIEQEFELRRCTMRENLQPGEKFPDSELVNENNELTKLSDLMRGFPTVVVFSRGYY